VSLYNEETKGDHMLTTETHTWTAAYKYYTRLSTESQAAFEAIQFDNQDTDLFSWLNSQLSTHNNLLDNPVQFSQWFESTYDFQNIVSSIKEVALVFVEEEIAPEVSVPVVAIDVQQMNTTPWDIMMSHLCTLTPDEQYIIMTQLGVIDFSTTNVQLPSGSTCYRTYNRRAKALSTKLSSSL